MNKKNSQICTACGANNKIEASSCHLCHVSLLASSTTPKKTPESNLEPTPQSKPKPKNPIVLETLDATTFTMTKGKLLVSFIFLFLALFPWVKMSDLLTTPKEIKQSRKAFFSVQKNYEKKMDVWSQQKAQILKLLSNHTYQENSKKKTLEISKLPLEVSLAYLLEEISQADLIFKKTSIYPKFDEGTTSLLLTKYQEGIWPLKILLSLNIQIEEKNNQLKLSFHELKRGKRNISPKLAWKYFLPELQSLKQLEPIVGGIKYISFDKSSFPVKQLESASPLTLSFHYRNLNYR